MDYLKKGRDPKQHFYHILSFPFIWGPLPFYILLDIVGEIYHQICFPLYGLEKVNRSKYIKIIDRTKLDYLNYPEKVNCMYCGYVNGLLLYQKEITGRTEKYWCGIMHEGKKGFIKDPNHDQSDFAKFNDEEDFKAKYK
jgi:hypothetical protein